MYLSIHCQDPFRKMGVVGLKTRSLGQILEKCVCVCWYRYKSEDSCMKAHQQTEDFSLYEDLHTRPHWNETKNPNHDTGLTPKLRAIIDTFATYNKQRSV